MPPNLEQANGRLFFKAIQTRELTGISQDSTQNASLKIVQEDGNTALQAVNPDGSLGAKLVIGATSAYLESTTGGGGAGASRMGFTSAGLVGVSGVSSELAGIETVPTPVGSIKFEGLVADNHDVNYQTVTTVAPSHTILRSTTSDLILAGNGLFNTNKRYKQPHGYLEISHNNNDQSGAITLSTPPMISPVDIVVKPATGIFGAEADTFELGSGDVRYKFTVVGGQLQIKKRVLSTGLPDKTICVFDA
eukprot:jgi/Mesvir1/11328/Mv02078-RA.1